MEKLTNYYTAASDQEMLTIKTLKEIFNNIPEDKLDYEVVVVDKIDEDLRGVPISNVILDEDGKQLTIFNFILRNKLRIEALNAVNAMAAKQSEEAKSQNDAN